MTKTIFIWVYVACCIIFVIAAGSLFIDWLIHRKDAWKKRDPYMPQDWSTPIDDAPIIHLEHEKQLFALIVKSQGNSPPPGPR